MKEERKERKETSRKKIRIIKKGKSGRDQVDFNVESRERSRRV